MGGGQSRGRGITRRDDDGGGEVADNKQAGYFILSFKEEKIKVLHCDGHLIRPTKITINMEILE